MKQKLIQFHWPCNWYSYNDLGKVDFNAGFWILVTFATFLYLMIKLVYIFFHIVKWLLLQGRCFKGSRNVTDKLGISMVNKDQIEPKIEDCHIWQYHFKRERLIRDLQNVQERTVLYLGQNVYRNNMYCNLNNITIPFTTFPVKVVITHFVQTACIEKQNLNRSTDLSLFCTQTS